MDYITYYSSPVGELTLASDGVSLIGLWLEGQKYYKATLSKDNKEYNELKVFTLTKKWLDAYFNNEKPSISDLPLAPRGTEFRKLVWKLLCEIPYGETTTYKNLSEKVALIMGRESMSSQAIGGAVGHNPISIIIPCHRVISVSGNLTGYAGGIDNKFKLLKIEGEWN